VRVGARDFCARCGASVMRVTQKRLNAIQQFARHGVDMCCSVPKGGLLVFRAKKKTPEGVFVSRRIGHRYQLERVPRQYAVHSKLSTRQCEGVYFYVDYQNFFSRLQFLRSREKAH
jgi:hypothetical protein